MISAIIDTTLTWVLIISGTLGILTVLGRVGLKMWRMARRASELVEYVSEELSYNSGRTLRDSVTRQERILFHLVEHLEVELPTDLHRPVPRGNQPPPKGKT